MEVPIINHSSLLHNSCVTTPNNYKGQGKNSFQEFSDTMLSLLNAPPFDNEDSNKCEDDLWAVKPHPILCYQVDENFNEPNNLALLLPEHALNHNSNIKSKTSDDAPISNLKTNKDYMSISLNAKMNHVECEPEFYPGDDANCMLSDSNETKIQSANTIVNIKDVLIDKKKSLTSFNHQDDIWAIRPRPEELYNNLENYFPNYDLDEPVVSQNDANENALTPRVGSYLMSSDLNREHDVGSNAFIDRSTVKMKSIRVIAGEAHQARIKIAHNSRLSSANLLRRKSAKLWGMRLEEVIPRKVHHDQLVMHDNYTITPGLERTKTFKWIKGDIVGKGTYGSIYLALNANTGELIAVKQVELQKYGISTEDERIQSSIDALNSEIGTMKELDHPNIVQYLGLLYSLCLIC